MRLPWRRENAELERELAYHIETLADGFEREGMTRAEALRRARREFGGVEQYKEECREESRWAVVVHGLQDLRFGWRMMAKSPAVSVAAVLSLALGIGATTAMYSLAEAVLWRSLAAPKPEQLMEVTWEVREWPKGLYRSTSGGNYRDGGLMVQDFFSQSAFEAMRRQAAGKVEVAGHNYPQAVSASYRGSVTVTRLRGVSENFFRMLGVQARLGRVLSEEPGAPPEVVVTHGFWEKTLGGRESAVGDTVRVNSFAYRIAGVLPPDFFGLLPGDETAMYATLRNSPAMLMSDSFLRTRSQDPLTWFLQVMARRAEGVTTEEAKAVLSAAFASTWLQRPESTERTPRLRLIDAATGLGNVRRDLGDPVKILLALVLLVLLLACANIANLLMARSAERGKEVALRVSLGCSRGRLMRQFLTESLLLAALGGALSIAVALGIGALMTQVLPANMDLGAMTVQWSGELLVVTAVVTLVTVVLFGLYPAWRSSRVDAAPALKEGTGSEGTVSRRRWRPAKALVLAQVAVSVLLVMGAILYTGYLTEILRRDAGFDRANRLLLDVRPGEVGYSDERLDRFYADLEDRLRAVPGVAAVGLSRTRPMQGGGYHTTIETSGKRSNTAVHHASAGFPAALGVPLLAGRTFTVEEVRGGRKVAILSEQLARELGLVSPLGARIRSDDQEWEVVGVARNAKYSRLTRDQPLLYVPLPTGIKRVTVLLRTTAPPLAVLSAAREAVTSLDPNLPLVDVFTMEQQIARTLQRERMFAWMCGSFGVLALVLCVVGLYGLMAHTTARRRPEIGIRMALGASSQGVLRQVVWEGMRLAVVGMAMGAPLAVYAAQVAQQQKLIPEGPIPYWTLAAVWGPAWRAASVDPMRALRQG